MEESEVKRVIAEKLGVPVDEKTQLAAVAQDSFAKVEMLFEIERQLGERAAVLGEFPIGPKTTRMLGQGLK
jgi:predicted phosphoribosyltransferase